MKGYQMFVVMVLLGCIAVAGPGWCQNDDPFAALEQTEMSLEEEMEWLRAETFVITASRVLENIKKSAASITVITEREIEQMGARYLVDVFQNIPEQSFGVFLHLTHLTRTHRNPKKCSFWDF